MLMNNNFGETVSKPLDINELVRRQDQLESELNRLRKLFKSFEDASNDRFDLLTKRIDFLEKELAELRTTINDIKDTIDHVNGSVIRVEKHVSEINVKQDVAITSQDKFISQLWKAFFAVLTLLSAAGTAIFAFGK